MPRKLLLATTASLAILFGGCSARNSMAAERPPESQPTVATVLQDYNTAASQSLNSMAADFNKERPKGVGPIVYVDYDQVVTWAKLRKDAPDIEGAIGDYLKAKTGKAFDTGTIEMVFTAMNGQQPTSLNGHLLTPGPGAQTACVVVPEYPGSTFESYYAAGFQVGDQLLLKDKVVVLRLTQQEFHAFNASHETWHCFDYRYRADRGDGLIGAAKDNHAEMFADIGGAMEAVRHGADLSFIDKIAAERAAWVFLTGPARARTAADDEGHFFSIVYNTQPGLYALKEKIQEMGIDNFRKLDRDQMRDLDYEIVEAHGLKFTEAAGLWSYYATGKAPAGFQGEVAQLAEIAAQTVRPATPAEIAAGKDAARENPAAQADMTAALEKRAGELGDPSSLANQLKARQEMTDALRSQLSKGPAAAQQAQAKLNILFLSNPRLPPKG